MEEEFRKLTLQIIGEAFLSLPPEECDKVCLLSLQRCLLDLDSYIVVLRILYNNIVAHNFWKYRYGMSFLKLLLLMTCSATELTVSGHNL